MELQNLKSELQKNERMRVELSDKVALLNSTILKQLDHIQQVSGIVEFGPLVKATGGLEVPRNQLKPAVIKAIDLLINPTQPGFVLQLGY